MVDHQSTVSLDLDFVEDRATNTSSPERRMWASIILQAVRDFSLAIEHKNRRGMEKIIHSVRSPGFRTICDFAGIEYCVVKSFFEKREPFYIGGKEWAK